MNLLQLVDQCSGEMGLNQPSSVISSVTNQTMQMLALIQRLGKDLIREYEWDRLVKAYRFTTSVAITQTATTVAGSTTLTVSDATVLPFYTVISGVGIPPYTQITGFISSTSVLMDTPASASGTVSLTFARQDYAPPTDFDRMISDTNWDHTNHWRNLGSRSSQDWQWLQGGVIATGPRERFRIYNGKMRIFPALTVAYNMAYEYVSNYYVIQYGASEPSKSSFTADTDSCIFPDDLMLAGLKYYFLKAKKLDFGAEMDDYNRILATRKGQNAPLPVQSLSPVQYPELVGPWSIQDGNWPQS
jgi:hypothetical protein